MVDELWVLRQAMRIGKCRVLPIGQSRAGTALPGTDLAMATREQEIEVAGETNLARAGHDHIESFGSPDNVVAQLHTSSVGLDDDTVTRRLVNRIVRQQTMTCHADSLTRVSINRVPGDYRQRGRTIIPNRDAGIVRVHDIASD